MQFCGDSSSPIPSRSPLSRSSINSFKSSHARAGSSTCESERYSALCFTTSFIISMSQLQHWLQGLHDRNGFERVLRVMLERKVRSIAPECAHRTSKHSRYPDNEGRYKGPPPRRCRVMLDRLNFWELVRSLTTAYSSVEIWSVFRRRKSSWSGMFA